MTKLVSSAAYAASQSLVQEGVQLKRTHLVEIAAACLGYHTHAALLADEADPGRDYHLDDAEIIVLNPALGSVRAQELGIAKLKAASVLAACQNALMNSATPAVKVFATLDGFYQEHAREALAAAIYEADEVSSAMAESNASFYEYPEMEEQYQATEDLWAARSEWTISASGVLTGEYDQDGDRMFNGDTLLCRGSLTYLKAGRAGLVFLDSDAGAAPDDSWRDPDREAEDLYREHIEQLKRDARPLDGDTRPQGPVNQPE
jgi:hypothetical protein